MSQITVKNLTFAYDGSLENVFEDASFTIDSDWKLGAIGRNGRGKTTLLKLLLGEYKYQGTIQKSINFRYFPFEIKDKTKTTIQSLQELNENLEEWRIIKELNLLKANTNILYRPFNTLSGGEQVKVLFASLFAEDNAFLLIDEPTNHLDNKTVEIIKDYLKSKKGFILVSHDRNLINEVVDHILAINKSGIDIQKGNFDSWKQNKENQDNFETIQNEKLQKDIFKLNENAKRTKNWADKIESSKIGNKNKKDESSVDRGYIGHQSAKMMQRAKNAENRVNNLIEEKSKLLKNIEQIPKLIIKPAEYIKNSLVIAKDISIKYGDKAIFENISFEINKGDRVAIVGKNGAGKSSILKSLLKENIEHEGELVVGNNIKISYISQDTSYLNGNLDNFARQNNIDNTIFRTNLVHLGFSKKDFEKEIQNLSEGQKKKILIAKSLTEEVELYIWDEPLNFVDIISKEQIEEAILKYKPTMIFVEHDKMFIENVATKVIEII
ncbi:MAG: ABC-F type ribosomal protection protein [Lachnospiraceae bacterium]|nr:ABC-F type ribosomal protection protein [Lachnospiraceae bacterium]